VILKFWNENINLVQDIEEGQQLLATNMLSKRWKNHPVHLLPTYESTFTVSEIPVIYIVL